MILSWYVPAAVATAKAFFMFTSGDKSNVHSEQPHVTVSAKANDQMKRRTKEILKIEEKRKQERKLIGVKHLEAEDAFLISFYCGWYVCLCKK